MPGWVALHWCDLSSKGHLLVMASPPWRGISCPASLPLTFPSFVPSTIFWSACTVSLLLVDNLSHMKITRVYGLRTCWKLQEAPQPSEQSLTEFMWCEIHVVVGWCVIHFFCWLPEDTFSPMGHRSNLASSYSDLATIGSLPINALETINPLDYRLYSMQGQWVKALWISGWLQNGEGRQLHMREKRFELSYGCMGDGS